MPCTMATSETLSAGNEDGAFALLFRAERDGQHARTGRTAPLRASSPMMMKFGKVLEFSLCSAATIPSAIGKSKLGPSFLRRRAPD